MSTNIPAYPVRIEGHLDPQLSRWKWLFKWLLLIPHFIVLFFLWIAMVVMTVVAFFAILFTGHYPRGIFDFNVGVMRWTWRVQFYGYEANGTDTYPPFTLAETDYPATLTVDYPEHLSRGLVLVKWWLLAIPHYIITGIFAGGGVWLAWNEGGDAWRWGGGLIGVLVLISAIALLFTAKYPRSIFDFIMGMNRWTLRVAGYVALMTDEYPPFRMDMGSSEPGSTPVAASAATTHPPDSAGAHPGHAWTAGRVVLVIVGSLVALVAAALLAGGTAAVVADQAARDESGFVMSHERHFTSTNYAIVSERIALDANGPDWIYNDLLGTVTLRSQSDREVFVAVARAQDVERYLGNVARDQVRDIGRHRADYTFMSGTATPTRPAAQTFWAATASGAGTRDLRWDAGDGDWQVVAMNADASKNVDVRLQIGAELPHLLAIAIGVMVAGAVLLALGGLLIYLGARHRPVVPPAQPAPAAA